MKCIFIYKSSYFKLIKNVAFINKQKLIYLSKTMETILFRWNRLSLDESMKTAVEIRSFDDLKALIIDEHPFASTRDIKIEYNGSDFGTGWDNYIVYVDGSSVGWVNCQLIPSNEINDVKALKLELLKIITAIGSEKLEDRLGLVDEIITIFGSTNDNCRRELDINEYVDITNIMH